MSQRIRDEKHGGKQHVRQINCYNTHNIAIRSICFEANV